MICGFCKKPIADFDRHIGITMAIDWGDDDERDPMPEKTQTFGSFKCVADYAASLAERHDGRTLSKEST